VLLLAIIILIFIIIFREMAIFLPGILGAVTLYILTNNIFKSLTVEKKWNKSLTALLIILVSLILISIPVYFSIQLISPKINRIISDPEFSMSTLRTFMEKIQARTGSALFTDENIRSFINNIANLLPGLLNSTANLLANMLIMFFLYFYMILNGESMEKYLSHIIPLKPENIHTLNIETRSMIRANALGIPAICFVQGVFAAIGFWIFGVEDWGMWGFLCGVFAFFPILGTMAIWIPVVIGMYLAGNEVMATGLTIYSIIVTGNVDYITRLVLMKKIASVHPIITVTGVIAGLGLFGFMGLIFGPLLVSYLIILVKIYLNEFSPAKTGNETHA
jgi:predicted PurR-regulated permease PerM